MQRGYNLVNIYRISLWRKDLWDTCSGSETSLLDKSVTNDIDVYW